MKSALWWEVRRSVSGNRSLRLAKYARMCFIYWAACFVDVRCEVPQRSAIARSMVLRSTLSEKDEVQYPNSASNADWRWSDSFYPTAISIIFLGSYDKGVCIARQPPRKIHQVCRRRRVYCFMSPPPVLVRPCLPRPSRTSAMRTLRWVVSISHMFTSRWLSSAGSWAPHDVVQWIRSKCPRRFRLSPCCRSSSCVLVHLMAPCTPWHDAFAIHTWMLAFAWWFYFASYFWPIGSEIRASLWTLEWRYFWPLLSYILRDNNLIPYTTTGDVFCIFFLCTKGDS